MDTIDLEYNEHSDEPDSKRRKLRSVSIINGMTLAIVLVLSVVVMTHAHHVDAELRASQRMADQSFDLLNQIVRNCTD